MPSPLVPTRRRPLPDLGSEHLDEEEKAEAERYNTELATSLKEPERHEQWREHCQKERFEHGKKCGLALYCENVTANDILCTVRFPDEFEVFEADDPPKSKPAPTMPERPIVGNEKRLRRMYRFLDTPPWLKNLGLPLALAPLRARLALHGPTLSVKDRVVTLEAAHLSPRRKQRFDGDSGLVVVAPSKTGEYVVSWSADCENLDAALTGELKVVVELEAE
jgi:hypothetical protein